MRARRPEAAAPEPAHKSRYGMSEFNEFGPDRDLLGYPLTSFYDGACWVGRWGRVVALGAGVLMAARYVWRPR